MVNDFIYKIGLIIILFAFLKNSYSQSEINLTVSLRDCKTGEAIEFLDYVLKKNDSLSGGILSSEEGIYLIDILEVNDDFSLLIKNFGYSQILINNTYQVDTCLVKDEIPIFDKKIIYDHVSIKDSLGGWMDVKQSYHVDSLGRKQGLWKIYYTSNEKLKEQGYFEDDNKIKRWKYWDNIGNLIRQENYNNQGFKKGKWYYYDENERVVKKEIYRNDKLIRSRVKKKK